MYKPARKNQTLNHFLGELYRMINNVTVYTEMTLTLNTYRF